MRSSTTLSRVNLRGGIGSPCNNVRRSCGWKTDSSNWQPKDWILFCNADEAGDKSQLTSEVELSDGAFQFDFRCPSTEKAAELPKLMIGEVLIDVTAAAGPRSGEWNRMEILLKGGTETVSLNGQRLTQHEAHGKGGAISILPTGVSTEFANLYVRSATN